MIPLARANIFAVLTYTWLSDIMRLGYQRTLQATDLWKLDEKRQAAVLSSKLDAAWDRRCKAAAEWNDLLSKGEINPGVLKRLTWTVKGRRAERERKWREKDGLKHASLAWALNEVFGFDFWCAGLFKVGKLDERRCTNLISVRRLLETRLSLWRRLSSGYVHWNPLERYSSHGNT